MADTSILTHQTRAEGRHTVLSRLRHTSGRVELSGLESLEKKTRQTLGGLKVVLKGGENKNYPLNLVGLLTNL